MGVSGYSTVPSFFHYQLFKGLLEDSVGFSHSGILFP